MASSVATPVERDAGRPLLLVAPLRCGFRDLARRQLCQLITPQTLGGILGLDVGDLIIIGPTKSFDGHIMDPSSGGYNETMHANVLKEYDRKELQCAHLTVTAGIINPSFYSYPKIKNNASLMVYGPETEELKSGLHGMSKFSLLSSSCDAYNKTIYNYLDRFVLKWLQFDSGLTSNSPFPKLLVEPFHGIVSLDACFTSDGAGNDMNIWALPIERPLGPGAQAKALWLDSGCAHHMVREENILFDRREPPPGKMIRIADGSLYPVRAVGTIKMPGFFIPEVYFVPGSVVNLISPGQLAEHHKINSSFDAVSCVLWTGQNIELVGEGIRDERRGIYRLTFLLVP